MPIEGVGPVRHRRGPAHRRTVAGAGRARREPRVDLSGVASAGEWLLLALRVGLVGVERVLLRALGAGRAPEETAAAFFGVGALVLLPFAAPWAWRDWSLLRVAAPAGAIYAGAYWLYVSALSAGEVSAVAPLGSLAGLLVVIAASLAYGESLNAVKLLGAALIAASAVALQVRRGPRGAAVTRSPDPARGRAAAWQMGGYALLTAATRMFDKSAAAGSPGAAAMYAWTVFTIVAACQGLALAWRGRLADLWRLLSARPWTAAAAGACNGGSFLILVVVMATVPVSVAEPVTACSLLVSAALARWVFGEPVRARWLPTAGVIAGTWLLVLRGTG